MTGKNPDDRLVWAYRIPCLNQVLLQRLWKIGEMKPASLLTVCKNQQITVLAKINFFISVADPGSLSRIPDPVVKKAPDTGSVSATLN
jgi:hypothetical protein